MNPAALILAGGRSVRMGRDKAQLAVAGRTLLARQIAVVREAGFGPVYISGRGDTDYSVYGCPVLQDKFPEAGPLAGIERGLAAGGPTQLLVLAVDLPAMDGAFLRRLRDRCAAGRGVVPHGPHGPEPLAAIYPTTAHAFAEGALSARNYAVHAFVLRCREAGLVDEWPIEPADEGRFLNWNRPEDLPAGLAVTPFRNRPESAPGR